MVFAGERINIILNFTAQTRKAIKDMENMSRRFAGSAGAIERAFNQMRPRFQMYLLSFMFFGMQMQRTSHRVMKMCLDSFMKITKGSGAAAEAVTRLSIHWEFLKFSIGSALAEAILPLLPAIIDIIDAIAGWIQQNPGLVAGILLATFLIGGFLFILGQVGLFINAVMILRFSQLEASMLASGKTGIASAGIISASFLGIVAIVAFVAIWIYYIWKEWGEVTTWTQKKEMAKRKKDWTAYKIFAIAEHIAMERAILTGAASLLHDIGILLVTGMKNLATFMLNILAFFQPGLAQITDGIETMFQDFIGRSAAGHAKLMEDMKTSTITKMAEAGVPLKDLAEVYGTTTETAQALIDGMEKGGYTLENIGTAFSNVNNAAYDMNSSIKTASDAMPDFDAIVKDVNSSMSGLNLQLTGKEGFTKRMATVEKKMKEFEDPASAHIENINGITVAWNAALRAKEKYEESLKAMPALPGGSTRDYSNLVTRWT